jgi:hypothetical protein
VKTYSASFIADDSKETTRLDLTVLTNFQNVAPTLTLQSCPSFVTAGEALVCTVRVDDPDPRDDPIVLTSTFINGGSFTYDAQKRVGTFTMVPPVTDFGLNQVDFTATDSKGSSRTLAYLFNVNRQDIATPLVSPIVGGEVKDAVFASGHLYTVNGGFLSIYQVTGGGASLVFKRHLLVPGGARRVRAAGDLLFVLGTALKAYDISTPEEPVLQVKYNLPDGPAANTFAVRTFASGPLQGGTYAYVGFGALSQLDTVRINTCEQVLDPDAGTSGDRDGGGGTPTQTVPAYCPIRVDSKQKVLQLGPDAGTVGIDRVEVLGDDLLLVTGERALRQARLDSPDGGPGERCVVLGFTTSCEEPRLSPLADPYGIVLPEGERLGATPGSGGSNRFGYEALDGGGRYRLSLAHSRTVPASAQIAVVDVGDGYALARASELPLSEPAMALTRARGTTYIPYTHPPAVDGGVPDAGVRVFDDDGGLRRTLALKGGRYVDVLVEGNLGFALAQTNPPGAPYLSILDTTTPASPTAGAELLLDVQEPGQPASYDFTIEGSPKTYLYVPRRDGPVAIFDVSGMLGAGGGASDLVTLPDFLPPANLAVRDALVIGRYLVLYNTETLGVLDNRRALGIFDLGVSAQQPAEITTAAFELPTRAALRRVVGIRGPLGERFLYVSGELCVPTCATPKVDAVHVLLIDPATNSVQHRGTLDPRQISSDPDPPIATANGVLYAADVAGRLMMIFGLGANGQPQAPPLQTFSFDSLFSTGELPAGGADSKLFVQDDVLVLVAPVDGERNAIFFKTVGAGPPVLERAGRLHGVGNVLAVAVKPAVPPATLPSTYVSTDRSGLLRIRLSEIHLDEAQAQPYLLPRIAGGQEAPNNAIGRVLLQGHLLVAVESTSVTLFRLLER